MRSLKFRAWNKVKKSMCWSFSIYKVNMLAIENPEEWVFLQYTGLTDKNGVEIYEGDIVEIPDHWDSTMPLVEVVKYIEATFMPFSDSDWGCDSDECKVIGNVHEYPEILEV